jgi:hypothetical protein
MAIKVKYLTEDEIEKDAKLLLAEYEDTIGEPIKLPVPIDDITTYHLALRLGFDDLHKTLNRPMLRGQPDILGAIWVEKELVLIDRHLDPKNNPSMSGRYRFSVAHEVGHWRLHRSYVARDPNQTTLFEAPTEPTVICPLRESGGTKTGHYSSASLPPPTAPTSPAGRLEITPELLGRANGGDRGKPAGQIPARLRPGRDERWLHPNV